MQQKLKIMSVRVSPAHIKAIEAEAKKSGRTKSEVIRALLTAWAARRSS